MSICWELYDCNEEESVLNMGAKLGQANTMIIEKTIRSRQIDQKFPPPGSVDFYHIY